VSLGIAICTVASRRTTASLAEDLGEVVRASTSVCSADLFNADLGEGIASSDICANGTMVNEDAGVCTPDPLPDATASFPTIRGEVAPDRARDCRLDGKHSPRRPTPGEMTIAADSMISDPEEKEEAAPLVLDEGSPPSIATKAALFEVPPLLEFSPNRAVPALSSVDISPSCGMPTTILFLSFPICVACYSKEQATADNL